jgi:UMF1 family MFS transporter
VNSNEIVKGDKKVINAWAFYDWANSVYPLVITTAIFPIFYESTAYHTIEQVNGEEVKYLEIFGYKVVNTAAISFVSALSFLLVSFMVPLLSGIADYMGNKKRFLQFFCYLGAVSCAGLYFFSPDYILVSLIIFMLASIGFWGSLVYYNAYLPEIAHEKDHDRISAKGFSLGYLGSSLLLISCLALIMTETMPARYAFVLTGIWWIGFSQITYRRLPNTRRVKAGEKGIIWKGFKELKGVFKQLKATTRLKRYLLAFFFYSMGVQTVMLMAVYFGTKEINWPDEDKSRSGLIISVLIIQFVAIGGAYLMTWISSKLGNLNALKIAVLSWVAICVSALWITEPLHFYIIAGCVGLVMGGIQALSRSTYAKFLPETKDTSSFFSFFDVAEKIGIVIGTLSYGILEQLTGSMRNSIFSLIVFFALGFIFLLLVPKNEKLIEE